MACYALANGRSCRDVRLRLGALLVVEDSEIMHCQAPMERCFGFAPEPSTSLPDHTSGSTAPALGRLAN